MKKYLIGAAAMLAMGTNLYAECTTKACYDKIERLFITDDGNVYVGTSGDESKLNCDLAYGKYLTLPAGDASKSMYSALLTAQTTGNKVLIRATGGSANCQISYVTIDKQ